VVEPLTPVTSNVFDLVEVDAAPALKDEINCHATEVPVPTDVKA
jgi:hypothetical protein